MALTFTQLVQDTFHRADENPLANPPWTPNPDEGSAALAIVSNVCQCADINVGFGEEAYTGIVWPNDQWIEVAISALPPGGSIASGTTSLGIRLNINDGTVGYQCGIFGGFAAGAGSVNLTSNQTLNTLAQVDGLSISANEVLRFGFIGTRWVIYLGGTLISTGLNAETASGTPSILILPESVANDTTVKNFAGGSISGFLSTVWSPIDSRVSKPNSATFRTVQGAQIDDVQTSSNPKVPSSDSRVTKPTDDRVSPNIPQNSRNAPPF